MGSEGSPRKRLDCDQTSRDRVQKRRMHPFKSGQHERSKSVLTHIHLASHTMPHLGDGRPRREPRGTKKFRGSPQARSNFLHVAERLVKDELFHLGANGETTSSQSDGISIPVCHSQVTTEGALVRVSSDLPVKNAMSATRMMTHLGAVCDLEHAAAALPSTWKGECRAERRRFQEEASSFRPMSCPEDPPRRTCKARRHGRHEGEVDAQAKQGLLVEVWEEVPCRFLSKLAEEEMIKFEQESVDCRVLISLRGKVEVIDTEAQQLSHGEVDQVALRHGHVCLVHIAERSVTCHEICKKAFTHEPGR
mmetsp:Transcript_14437/g.39468  ORF Transcript_14437/g.39468 Transcript_14437/m.39468 type:complete len:307 (-) Transcript_14437:369-1289(-)